MRLPPILVLGNGSQLGLDSQPAPSAMCLSPTGYNGSVARDIPHRDSGFPIKSSASSRGRTTRRLFRLRQCKDLHPEISSLPSFDRKSLINNNNEASLVLERQMPTP